MVGRNAKEFVAKCQKAVDEVKKVRVSPDETRNNEINQKLQDSVRLLDELVHQGAEINKFEGLNDCYGFNPQVSAEQFDSRLLDNEDCEGGSKVGESLDPKLREQLEVRKSRSEELSKQADQLDNDLSKTGNLLVSAVTISVSSNAKRMLKEVNQLLGNESMPRSSLYLQAQEQESIQFADRLTNILNPRTGPQQT